MDGLNAILAVQRVKVKEQSENCEKMLVTIRENTEVAIEKKTKSEAKSKEIEDRNKIIAKESAEAKEALNEAQPAVDSARAALGKLDKSDITEIRCGFEKFVG